MTARLARLRRRRPPVPAPVGRLVREEDGQALFLFVASVVVLIGFLAFAIDVGGWFASDRNLQKGADNAAIAAAEEYVFQNLANRQSPPGTFPCNITTWDSCATTVGLLNGAPVDTDPSRTFAITPANGKCNPSCTFTVGVKDAAPPNAFASFFGVHPIIRRSATATLGPAGGGGNVMPFGFPSTVAGSWTPGQVVTFSFDTQVNSGTFGLLGIGNCNSANAIAGCITPSGCGCSLAAPVTVPSGQGNLWNSNGVSQAFQAMINTSPQPTVLVPIYDPSQTTNSSFYIVGFAGFIVTYFTAQGHNITLKGQFEGIVGGTLCTGSCQSFSSYAVGLTG